jgi:hypothetical protein
MSVPRTLHLLAFALLGLLCGLAPSAAAPPADAAARTLPAARVAAISPGVVTLPEATLGVRRGDTFRDRKAM